MKELGIKWWKALIAGFIIFWLVGIIGFVIFVGFGMGYSFPNIANTFAHIWGFPMGTYLANMFFWTIVLAGIIKTINFFIVNK